MKRKRNLIPFANLPPAPTSMEKEEEKMVEEYYDLANGIPNPISMITQVICFQLTKIIYKCVAILLSPSFFLSSLVSESFHQAEIAKESVELAASGVPSAAAQQITIFLRKMAVGFLGAVYVFMVVTMVMALAIILGIGFVQLWVEDPVFVRERLNFDYASIHPNAVFSFAGEEFTNPCRKKKTGLAPVGHTLDVSLLLLLPESDFNLQTGAFQLTAELISTNGYVIAKSSQPCMLQFRSLPIWLMRTILMGIPILLGITMETQKIIIPMLKHVERYPRTEAIRISMIPRAGTSFVPQLYEAEIIINSQLPWRKEIMRRWKWTCCVWTSIYTYVILLIILGHCFKPVIFPMKTINNSTEYCSDQQEVTMEWKERRKRGNEEREISEELKRWKQSRSKRKTMLLRGV